MLVFTQVIKSIQKNRVTTGRGAMPKVFSKQEKLVLIEYGSDQTGFEGLISSITGLLHR